MLSCMEAEPYSAGHTCHAGAVLPQVLLHLALTVMTAFFPHHEKSSIPISPRLTSAVLGHIPPWSNPYLEIPQRLRLSLLMCSRLCFLKMASPIYLFILCALLTELDWLASPEKWSLCAFPRGQDLALPCPVEHSQIDTGTSGRGHKKVQLLLGSLSLSGFPSESSTMF